MRSTAPALVQSDLVLGRYRPLRPLGSGGSGSVWLARDEQNGLDVALKIVPREGKTAARAEREAEAAARLRHPGCQRVYGFGRDSRHVYIAYEYVPGRTFREALRGGDLDDAAAIEAAVQILEALAHAHARGIVHRDVKPSNVLLAEGRDVSVRVLDFGLAKMREAETLTAQGDVPGTLAYIAPERLAGELTTEAADVWAVGVMLWEALAGRHPFWRSSLLDTARAIETGPPPLETLRPDLPRSLLGAVARSLDLDAGRRPSAAAFADALRVAGRKRRSRTRGRGPGLALPAVAPRLVPAVLAALVAGWTAWAVPFYPAGWAFGLGALTAAVTFLRPRAGLALTLAVPLLPLGNLALGAAVLYAFAALGLLVLAWREPEQGLLFSLGPLLAPLSALGLLPLAVQTVRSTFRRGVQVAAAVLVAGLVAGIRNVPMPFDGATPPRGLGVAASGDPFDIASVLGSSLLSRPALAVEAVVLAAVAVLLPLARARGPWAIAALGAGFLAASVLAVPAVTSVPLVVAVWATCVAVAVR
ncbi:MAG TPA: serine/threonine-protein kinase [Gaiellaceae bacterium]